MATFQTKIGWKCLRKRENKNDLSVPFLPKVRERAKIKLLFRSDPMHNGKFQKN